MRHDVIGFSNHDSESKVQNIALFRPKKESLNYGLEVEVAIPCIDQSVIIVFDDIKK